MNDQQHCMGLRGRNPADGRWEPAVTMASDYTADSGQFVIDLETYSTPQLADLIEPALREVAIRLGPDALSGREYADLARAAAHAIIHRRDTNGDDHA
ncbi:hypothetical protein AB0451_03375 [Streptomyces sp. NPDC052000]|uniref:hypothetical protein n=1 Tax=Streptomyces sp. NPDC052000 TaxID=3155676 RepID=UPI00344DBDBF